VKSVNPINNQAQLIGIKQPKNNNQDLKSSSEIVCNVFKMLWFRRSKKLWIL